MSFKFSSSTLVGTCVVVIIVSVIAYLLPLKRALTHVSINEEPTLIINDSNFEKQSDNNKVDHKANNDKAQESENSEVVTEVELDDFDVIQAFSDKLSSALSESLNYDDDWCFIGELTESASAQATREIHLWKSERGLYSKADRQNYSNYSNYSRETLTELANQGDLLALDVLSRVYLFEDKNNEKFNEVSDLAIVRGSLAPLKYSTYHYRKQAERALDKNNSEEFQRNLSVAIFYTNISMLRGFNKEVGLLNDFLNKYNVQFNDEQLESLDSAAEEKYKQLEMKRLELGLSEFDNSIPKVIDVLYQGEFGDLLGKGQASQWVKRKIKPSRCVQEHIEFQNLSKQYKS